MKTIYIVWNENKSEGFVTDDKDDAKYCSTGKETGFGIPTIAEAFRECYGQGPFKIEKMELKP